MGNTPDPWELKDEIDEINRIADCCERDGGAINKDPLQSVKERLIAAVDLISRAWSGSWCGSQAVVYKSDLQPKRPEDRRRNRVMLNLTDDEYRALLDVAGDRPPSNYARYVLMRHLRRQLR